MEQAEIELMPREKLLQYGAQSLTDEELLAIFLRTGIKGIPVMNLAESVLIAFGSLRGLLSASQETFCQIKGLGLAQYVQLQATKEMFFGTINQTSVYPREVIKVALKHNAAAIIVAHNHPSGSCVPSESDRQLTQKMEQACDLVDIRFVDHIIVGKGDYFSFTEEKVQAKM